MAYEIPDPNAPKKKMSAAQQAYQDQYGDQLTQPQRDAYQTNLAAGGVEPATFNSPPPFSTYGASNMLGGTPGSGAGIPGPQNPQSVAAQWNAQPQATPAAPDYLAPTLDKLQTPQADPRSEALFAQLQQRAGQGLNVQNDPNIRQQSDVYGAQQERIRRNYLADVAEKAGPGANIAGERRMGYERMAQDVGGFEAELVGREIEGRRAEIADALQQMGNLLSVEQQQELQRELALLDQASREQSMQMTRQGMDQDWRTALLNNEQFVADLGLKAEDRRTYWDAIRSGQIEG